MPEKKKSPCQKKQKSTEVACLNSKQVTGEKMPGERETGSPRGAFPSRKGLVVPRNLLAREVSRNTQQGWEKGNMGGDQVAVNWGAKMQVLRHVVCPRNQTLVPNKKRAAPASRRIRLMLAPPFGNGKAWGRKSAVVPLPKDLGGSPNHVSNQLIACQNPSPQKRSGRIKGGIPKEAE